MQFKYKIKENLIEIPMLQPVRYVQQEGAQLLAIVLVGALEGLVELADERGWAV